MKLTEIYLRKPYCFDILEWKWLIPITVIGMSLTAIMGWMGFPWKLYNDILSLLGYTSLALMIYKVDVFSVNNFFTYTNRLSYEWYLVHFLVFQIVRYCIGGKLYVGVEIFICLLMSYLITMGYMLLWKKGKHNNGKSSNSEC